MLFYDHLITLEDLERELKDVVETPEEREELWHLIDEIIHHRVLHCVLDHLPHDHHETFLTRFHDCPHDHTLLPFINDLTNNDLTELIIGEISSIQDEILQGLLSV